MSSLRNPTYVLITLSLIIHSYLINTTHSDRHRNDRDTHHSQISLDNFPNPLSSDNIASCGRGQKSFICDPKQFLKPKIADEIDKILFNATESHLVWCSDIVESHQEGQPPKIISNPNEKTRENYAGLEIGVAIISSFNHFSHTRLRRSDDIAKKCTIYAKSIHDQWGVGQAGCNNAAVIFINIYDRYLYVSTGSGIKKIIADDFIEKFIIPKHVRPLMRANKYGKAVKLIIESIIEILRESDNLKNNKLYQQYIEFTTPAAFLGILYETWFIIILVLCGVGYLGYKFHSERDYRECERKLAQLYAQKQAKKFAGSSCPICLEDFPPPDSDHENARETAILICGHKFCKDCLDGWFNSQSATNQKCPICRHDRDDWSAVSGEGKEEGKDDERKEERKEDYDEKHDDYGQGSGGGSSAYKSSTSDNFYDTQQSETNTATNTNNSNGGGFGFRRRRGNRYGYGGMDMNDWMFQQEMMFRMSRMRYYYPRYVTRDMTDRWSRPGYSGSYTGDQSFRRSNPNYRPPRSTSSSGSGWGSSRSSGFSFGGGSSSGGGGGGGGW